MESITYNKANINDVQNLVDLRIAFAIELSGQQSPDDVNELKKQMTTYFTAAMANGSCISFIAKCNGEIAGIGSAQIREQPGNFKNPSGKWAYIMNMYTLPVFRKRGICAEILNKLVEEVSKTGVTAFELHATPSGEKVYVKHGFLLHNEPTLRKFIHLK